MPDDVTRTATTGGIEGLLRSDPLVLTVVHRPGSGSPRPPALGHRRLLEPGTRVVLGRGGDALGPGGLDDSRISRKHAEITVMEDHIAVRDLGSHNGTTVGSRTLGTDAVDVGVGSILGVGSTLLLLHREPAAHEPPEHPRITGVSAAVADILEQVRAAAPRATAVLVVGEPGVGKELVARELHLVSGRRGDLVPVNAGGLGAGVAQSELFGHERGAFTGAERTRGGLVEQARGGTLFLDEIGDAPGAVQVALLRVLQENEVRRVGSDRTTTVDVRFVAATNRDLAHEVDAGRFREDLRSRLERWVIRIPPLRDRRLDILPIARELARRYAGRPVALSRNLALALVCHDWPGNVRELHGVVERVVVEAAGADLLDLTPRLAAELLPAPVAHGLRVSSKTTRRRRRPSADELRQLLAEADGNVKALAARLGVGRTTLYRWFADAQIDPEEVRST